MNRTYKGILVSFALASSGLLYGYGFAEKNVRSSLNDPIAHILFTIGDISCASDDVGNLWRNSHPHYNLLRKALASAVNGTFSFCGPIRNGNSVGADSSSADSSIFPSP